MAEVDYEQVIADLTQKRDAIDAAISSLRRVIGLPEPIAAREVSLSAPSAPVQAVASVRSDRWMVKCEVCGKEFERVGGVSGRFCSRVCYGGYMDVDERRALILKTVLERGPMFPSQLADVLGFKNHTVHNDLSVLGRTGQIENGQDGWQAVASASVEETAVQDEDPDAPFDQARPSIPTSLQNRSA